MPIPKINIVTQTLKYVHTCVKSDLKSGNYSGRLKPLLKDMIEISRKKVDFQSKGAKFFGISSMQEINNHIYNQSFLTAMKNRELDILQPFLDTFMIDLEQPNILFKIKNELWQEGKIDKLFDYGAAKITLLSKMLGKNFKTLPHSVGIVADKNTETIYILDSSPVLTQGVQNLHQFLKEMFTNPKSSPLKIIFSTKPQQTPQEFSCNNWVYANIEALKNALKEGQVIDSSEKLNKILPDDINKILEEQRQYVLVNKEDFIAHRQEYLQHIIQRNK